MCHRPSGGVGLDRLWSVGLDWSWVLAWFEVGVAQMVIAFFFLAWFEIGIAPMVKVEREREEKEEKKRNSKKMNK